MARIDRLRTLADKLEASIDEASVGVRAQLAAQYRATLAEIDALDGAANSKAGDLVDEVAQRRAARGAGPAASEGRARNSR